MLKFCGDRRINARHDSLEFIATCDLTKSSFVQRVETDVDLGDALEAAIGGAFKAGQAMALILSQRFLGAKPFGGGVN